MRSRFTDALQHGYRMQYVAEVVAEDLAFLQYTGGTTGVAGAMLTHRNMLANLERIESDLWAAAPGKRAVVVTTLPLYHILP